VDVRLLLPSESDSELALTVGRSNYRELLEAGVKIYETRNQVLHSKAAVVDGVWTIIGSSNFDRRSVIFNDEIDSVVLGRDTGQQMDAMFEEDFKQATPIDLAAWKKAGVYEDQGGFLQRMAKSALSKARARPRIGRLETNCSQSS
jgi:cardiolipin synthase